MASVRGSGPRPAGDRRRSTPTTTSRSPWPASSRRARSSTTSSSIAIRRSPSAPPVEVREQVIPGFTEEPIRTESLPRRVRRVLGDRSVRPGPIGGPRRAGQRRELRRGAAGDVRVIVVAEVARNYFELRGLQQQLAVLERSLANQRETLRLTEVRRDAGLGEEQDVASAAARVAAIDAGVPPVRAALAGARAPAGGAGRRPAGRRSASTCRRGPIRCWPRRWRSATRRRSSTGGPDVRAAERRLAMAPAREGVAAAELYPAHHRLGRARPPGRPRQRLRQRRLAGLGGDAGAELGGVRPGQRPGAAARRRGGHARVVRRLRADGAAGASRKPRTRWSPTASSSSGWCGWPTRCARARGPPASPGSATARASPTSWRCSTPSARSCRPRTR